MSRPSPGRITFLNPNDPEQPAGGVYRWFVRNRGGESTLYVGCAGARRVRVAAASTLARGVGEARRSCLSSDRGRSIDTDFIVGTALLFLRRHGFDCYWQHMLADPSQERLVCELHRPLLQARGTTIAPEFRLHRTPGSPPWVEADAPAAEQALFAAFATRWADLVELPAPG